jgi:uncharacterized membrane protein (UPF0127 family)
MKVEIKYGEKILSSNILIADNPVLRVIGLMFKARPQGDGLLLEPCNSIHTFFMRYSLDIVFLSRSNEVVKIIRDLKPWRMTRIYFKARKTLEVPAGKLPMDIKVGDILEVQSV